MVWCFNPGGRPRYGFDMKSTSLTRRAFLQRGTAVALAFPMVSRFRVLGANGRLNIAAVGVGGKGATDVTKVGGEHIVGLCDVDAGRLAQMGGRFGSARRFADWREMFDALGKEMDAVTVSTPDHMHFPPTMAAIRMGKHVYCQKPLTHTVAEARALTEAARKARVATQMGNQGMGHGALRREAELVRAGVLGTVREAHVWTDRPGAFWRQGLQRPTASGQPPSGLSWDLWLGVAPQRPYAAGYHPFAWRGFWDFGTGALGDMGCHLVNILALAFHLRDPLTVQAQSAGGTGESAPLWSVVTYQFPALPAVDGKPAQPALKLVWHDGGSRPDPSLYGGDLGMTNGIVLVGDRDTLVTSYEGGGRLLSGAKVSDFKEAPELYAKPADWEQGHYDEWVAACKGGKTPPASRFDVAGPVTEAVLLGNVAIRSGSTIRWDARRMRTGDKAADALLAKKYPAGWRV